MKGIFKWWTALEICKFSIIIIPIIAEVNLIFWAPIMSIICLTLTFISYRKIIPVYKSINQLIFNRKEYTDVELLMRARSILYLIMLCDLLPFIPGVQAVLRYLYYKKFRISVLKEIEVEKFLSK